jgi:ABC-2 type transport system permease protein
MLLFWLIILTLFGALNGALAKTATNLIAANPQFLKLIYHAGYSSPVDSYFAVSLGLFAIVFAVYAIIATITLRSEESERYSELMLTNSVSRNSWVASNLVFGFLGPALIAIIFSIAMAWAYGYSAGTSYDPTKLIQATLVYLPAIWILTGITVLLFGLKPKLTGLSWAALGLFLIVNILGEFSNVNQNILNLSPFTQVPNILIGNTIDANLGWVFILAIAITIIGVYSYNHRDING